ncbi:MAG: DinB family protein [Dehalococcoidia bacterium]
MADEAAIQDLIEKMTREREALLHEVSGLDTRAIDRVPVGKTGEEQWTVKEQLAHLCVMERSYDAWVAACLRDDDPDLSTVAIEPVAIPIAAANGHALQELLDAMAAERLRTRALIDGLRPEDYDRTGRQPMFGRLTVLQWLRSFYRHDRMHRDQIAGRDPEYKPRFVNGVEPDQRGVRPPGAAAKGFGE